MHFKFDEDYLARARTRVAMFVANRVMSDSRVLKTAQTVKKLGYDLTVFGLGSVAAPETVLKYDFKTVLLPNPAQTMKRQGTWDSDPAERDFDTFTDLAAESLAQALSAFEPQILHTHDMIGLTVGAKVRDRLECTGQAWLHDIHEYTHGLTELPDKTRRFFQVETDRITAPDRLTCVSPALADLLVERHGLSTRPEVVLNAPRLSDYDSRHPVDIRSALGLGAQTPLLVYSGGVKPVRGVATVIEAMPQLPDMHLALITNASGDHVNELLERAAVLGIRERVHMHPYVPFMNVTSFLRSATLGVHPIQRYPNAEIALPNKLMEYLHAGLPSIVSDNQAMAEFVRTHDCGIAFTSGDPDALAAAIAEARGRLRREPDWVTHLHACAQNVSWEAQEIAIAGQYAAIDQFSSSHTAIPASAGTRILQLPVAAANQPASLAEALRELGYPARSFQIGRHPFGYASDLYYDDVKRDRAHEDVVAELLDSWDVLHYHGRPLTYAKNFSHPTALDLLYAKLAGRRVFFHFRGTEARLPSVFRDNSPYHYASEDHPDLFSAIPEARQRTYHRYIQGLADATFVVDPELQTYAPDSLIVPRAFDVSGTPEAPPRNDRPLRIVHAPSRRGIKGTSAVQAAVDGLRRDGYAIELTLVEAMDNQDALAAIREADVIVDQLRIGWYGVAAVEAMAMGKAVVAFVRDDLKHHLPWPAPIAIANPDTVRTVIADLATDRQQLRMLGRRARAYASELHDARHIARMLSTIYTAPWRPPDPRAIESWLHLQTVISAERTKAVSAPRWRRTWVVRRLRTAIPRQSDAGAATKRARPWRVRKRLRDLGKILYRDGPGAAFSAARNFLRKRAK